MTRSVLFLDVDGVLNSESFFVARRVAGGKRSSQADDIDPAAVVLLNELVTRSGCEVVVSSTWRYFGLPELRRVLGVHGYTGPLVDVTPRSWDASRRGDEIMRWLDRTMPVTSMVILDDESDMGTLLPWLVQTSWRTGLQREHVERALAMLQHPAWRPQPLGARP